MNARRLKFTPRAIRDLDEIWTYSTRQWNVDRADHYIRSNISVCERVANNPQIALNRDDIRANYHSVLSGSHIIFFKQAPDAIQIIRVLHQRMDADSKI